MAILAQDTFTRANTAGSTLVGNAAGWGTASDGNSWSAPAGSGGTWKITSNEGTQTANFGTVVYLGSSAPADAEGVVRLTSSNFTTHFPGVLLRGNALGTTYYFARVDNLGVRIFDEAFTTIATYSLTTTNSTFYWVRFRAVGTTLSVKLWADGSGEPGSWNATGTSSAHTSGQYGLYEHVGASGSVSFDSLSFNDTASGVTHTLICDGYGGVFS